MDISSRKAQFSIAYVKAIAAQIGLNPSIDDVDNDSVDITFKGTGFTGGLFRNPHIEVQLKCTSQDVVKGNVVKYPLKIKYYDDLRGEDVVAPRYLMILVVPDDPKEWTDNNDNSLTLFNTCYWASLRYLPGKSNTTNVTVEVSAKQKVTPDTLMNLMEKASKAEFI